MTIFVRCNGGHYFYGESCPYDGWTHPDIKIILEEGNNPIEYFEDKISSDLYKRIMEIKIPIHLNITGIDPSSYVINGNVVPRGQFPLSLL